MNEHLGLRLAPRRASTPGPPPDTRARMSRFACAFSLVRTVMRRAAPPAALGLVATLVGNTPSGPDGGYVHKGVLAGGSGGRSPLGGK